MIKVPVSTLHNPQSSLCREWLVTNGIGGYASSTVIGSNTRRYHGLLVASFPPPIERLVLLAKVDEEVLAGGETIPLSVNEYWDGTLYPRGDVLLRSFSLRSGLPLAEYGTDKWRLAKRLWMERGRNTVYVLYTLPPESQDVTLKLRPFCAFRSYHDLAEQGTPFYARADGNGRVQVTRELSSYSLYLSVADASFCSEPDWYRRFLYRRERDRGFDYEEDLWTPGCFTIPLRGGESVCLIASCETETVDICPVEALEREIRRRKLLCSDASDSFTKELMLAADQFVVDLPVEGGLRTSILAGYHWFTDWGRDTMVSLPGLLLSTGRFSEARDILLSYAEHIDQGMVPNRFSDSGNPEYNTVDASLWYFEATRKYIQRSGDEGLVRCLFPRLQEIIDWHISGTRYGIGVDQRDGLLMAGEAGTQLTWMDATVDGRPVTPRIGKPVEINALWYNALVSMAEWAHSLGCDSAVYGELAEECRRSFRKKFWYEAGGYLFDVVDGPGGDDNSLRPNQIIAVSLENSPLDSNTHKAVVDMVERELLTPFGLRTLSPEHVDYKGQYTGGPADRDSAYHQGTVWPWLLGPFAEAHWRVYRDRERIRQLIEPLRLHMSEAGLGSISEVFDGDPPQTPGGCIAQAWSVAEILRICTEVLG